MIDRSRVAPLAVDPHGFRSEPGFAGNGDAPAAAGLAPLALAPPRRGRPPEMSAGELLDRIRRLAHSREGLFRVHERNSGLYARARRGFGSWSAAVRAAGLDYGQALNGARERALKTRRRRSRRAGAR